MKTLRTFILFLTFFSGSLLLTDSAQAQLQFGLSMNPRNEAPSFGFAFIAGLEMETTANLILAFRSNFIFYGSNPEALAEAARNGAVNPGDTISSLDRSFSFRIFYTAKDLAPYFGYGFTFAGNDISGPGEEGLNMDIMDRTINRDIVFGIQYNGRRHWTPFIEFQSTTMTQVDIIDYDKFTALNIGLLYRF